MKHILNITLILLLFQGVLHAQSGLNGDGIEIMNTVIQPDDFNEIDLKIDLREHKPDQPADYSPNDDEAGLMIISDAPFKEIEIRIPPGVALTNQYGDETRFTDIRMTSGVEEQAEAMQTVSPGSCIELIMPRNGRIFIRIGGSVESEAALRGIYTGRLSILCDGE